VTVMAAGPHQSDFIAADLIDLAEKLAQTFEK
jgi:hypothetical protein